MVASIGDAEGPTVEAEGIFIIPKWAIPEQADLMSDTEPAWASWTRCAPAPPSYDDLEALWADCPPVRADDVLGSWAGSDFGPGHPVHEMLATSGWHGKRFESTRKAHPLICRDADGELFSNDELGRGLASLWDIEFRGEVTASMVYDGQPVDRPLQARRRSTPSSA